MDGWMDRQMDGQMDGWIDGWIDGWMDGQMDGQIGGWIDGWMDIHFQFPVLLAEAAFVIWLAVLLQKNIIHIILLGVP